MITNKVQSQIVEDKKKIFFPFYTRLSKSFLSIPLLLHFGMQELNKQNITMAIRFYDLAAQQNSFIAQNSLGCIYFDSKKKVEEGFLLFQCSALQNYHHGQYNLGLSYQFGLGTKKDLNNAIQFFSLAANQGNSLAKYRLGLCFKNGCGVKQNLQKATLFFKLAVADGLPEAENSLAILYEHGTGSVKQNINEAISLYQSSANKGFVHALCNLAIIYFQGSLIQPNFKKAFQFIQMAISKNNARAWHIMGQFYEEQKSFRKAVHFYKLSASKHYAPAEYDLSLCFEDGIGIERDTKKAIQFCKRAAKKNNPYALNNLGVYYRNKGGKLDKNFKLARTYYQLATEYGSSAARENLKNIARCYKMGLNVLKDINEYRYVVWFSNFK